MSIHFIRNATEINAVFYCIQVKAVERVSLLVNTSVPAWYKIVKYKFHVIINMLALHSYQYCHQLS